MTAALILQDAIEELYSFRDNYYMVNPSASEADKTGDIEKKLKDIRKLLDSNGGGLCNENSVLERRAWTTCMGVHKCTRALAGCSWCLRVKFDSITGTLEKADRAVYQMLLGKALNIRREYDSETHEALSRAVKLNPKLVEAWNELGECYWKKGDILKARNCFEGVLKIVCPNLYC